MLYNFSEINKSVLNYFVAASNLDAILTFGDKYDASILKADPIAPSIAQPKLSPKPILTL